MTLLTKIKFVIKDNFEDIIKGLGSLLLFLILMISDMEKNQQNAFEVFWGSYIDRSVITSILLVFIFNILLSTVFSYFRSRNEEKQKIATTPEEVQDIVKKYTKNKLFTFKDIRLPAIVLYQKRSSETNFLRIKDSKTRYQTPAIVNNNYDTLMGAHHSSTIFNNIVIRVEDSSVNDNVLTLFTMRSTFFDSLVTNRSLDKKLSTKQTLRETLDPGPQLSELPQSSLSNHLGFNIFVITSDKKIILVKRSRRMSISKNVLGPSVAASLKTKYALDDEGWVTEKGIEEAIVREVEDELKISKSDIKFDLRKDVYFFYRELIEGGKPQLLGLARTAKRFEDVVENFNIETNREDQDNNIIDGKLLLSLTRVDLEEQLERIAKTYTIYVREKKYKVSPAHATSLAMIAQYIKE